jgi:hypothetical protein
MTAIASVVRLDLLSVRPYAKQMTLLLAVAAVLGITMDDPAAVLPMSVVYAVLAASYPFAIADKNDLDTLYAVLPLRRSALVVGRYLYSLVVFTAATVAGGAVAMGIAVATDRVPTPTDAALLLAVSFLVFGGMVAVQYPLYLRLGYMRSRLVANLPFMALLAGVLALGRWIEPASLPPAGVIVSILVGTTTALLGVSLAVAWRLDARR